MGEFGRLIRRIVVTTVGATLLGIGAVLLVIPGPGILMIAAGLAVLATEYDWARDALHWIKRRAARLRERSSTPPKQGALKNPPQAP